MSNNIELDEEFDFTNQSTEETQETKLLEQLENTKSLKTDNNINDVLAHQNFEKLIKQMGNKTPQERMAFLTQLQNNMSKMTNKDLKDVNIDEKEKRRRELRELINNKKMLRTGKNVLKHKLEKNS
jgi:hypothetical protein